MSGQLFTQYFLTDGIRHTPEWRASVEESHAFTAFAGAVAECFEAFSRYDSPNESVTEQDLIRPVLALLGWVHNLPQQGAARNEDIPDHLLFADAESKARAASRGNSKERYRDALLIEESKRFGLPLDTRDATDKARSGTPHGPDTPLPVYRRQHHGRKPALGHPDQRRRLAGCTTPAPGRAPAGTTRPT
jgi:hypothetical protein